MTAVVDNLMVEAGATFTKTYRYLQPTPDPDTGVRPPVDLTGYTARVQVRAHPKSAETIVDVEPEITVLTGSIKVVLTAAQTSLLTATGGVWALELTHASGEPVIRLVKGKVFVDPETVR